MSRKLLYTLCAIMLSIALLCPLFVAADSQDGHITVDTVTAAEGDSVIVPIRIENNPGIMAITISITYDSKALTYEKYYRGYLSDYTVADHPDKGIVRFVNCESRDRTDNDIMISLQFHVAENASGGLHPISISYKSGDFCQWSLAKPMPKITSGGVDIPYTDSNCSHKSYSEWEVVANPACTEDGAKQRTCLTCGHVERESIAAIGHEYAEVWTIDQPATAESDGIMSRHCLRCSATIDTLTFSLSQSTEGKIENQVNKDIEPSPFTDQLVKEQISKSQRQSNHTPDSSSFGKNKSGTGGSSTDSSSLQDDNGQIGENEKNDVIDGIIEQIQENGDSPMSKILAAFPNSNMLIKRVIACAVLLFWLLI